MTEAGNQLAEGKRPCQFPDKILWDLIIFCCRYHLWLAIAFLGAFQILCICRYVSFTPDCWGFIFKLKSWSSNISGFFSHPTDDQVLRLRTVLTPNALEDTTMLESRLQTSVWLTLLLRCWFYWLVFIYLFLF